MPADFACQTVPMTLRQRTIANSIKVTGVGLHSGCSVLVQLQPGEVDSGIVFVRTDGLRDVEIPAQPQFVNRTRWATGLCRDGFEVSTVEHLLSALVGLGIDNVRVALDAPELPIMDGSAAPFVFLLQSAGIVEQTAPRRFLRVLSVVEASDDDATAAILPGDQFRVSYTLEYDHPVLNRSVTTASVVVSPTSFVKEVSRARTFGFLSDYEALRSQDQLKGGGLHNAVVLGDSEILNQDGLRSVDEFAKHKILDAIGDLGLLGHPLLGEFRGFKSGHTLNNRVIRKLLDTPGSFELVSVDERADQLEPA